VQYYTPIWHGNPFTPYVSNPSAVGEVISANSVVFGGNGLTTATGGTATPGNWFSPAAANIGASYYINITKTGGLSGINFSAAQGAWTNIGSGGLTISSNAYGTLTGTYQLSPSVTGSPVAASGTITLAGGNGVRSIPFNGATPILFAGNGATELNGVITSNWYSPTTTNIGSGFYIKLTRTGGTSGYNFSAASSYTNITNGGLTVGVTGSGASTFSVTGTYTIASDSGGVTQLGQGTITLTGSNVQSPNYSGTTPLIFAQNGTATLNGVGSSNWYSPTTAGVGALFWVNITRTGGTSGVNFSAAQGSWTNITNSGLSVGLSGYTGDVGTVSASGTYQISNSATGMPVLGSGSITLSLSGLTLTRTYNSGTSATETAPTGSSFVKIRVWGGGGQGGSSGGSGKGGGGGGGGFSESDNIPITGGQTLIYTVGLGGSTGTPANPGQAGFASTVSSGTKTITTMTANGGGFGAISGVAGAGGTASGGTTTNTQGFSGATGGGGSAGGASGAGNTGVPGGGGAGTVSSQAGVAGSVGQVQFIYS
jgi:hypothetical protein